MLLMTATTIRETAKIINNDNNKIELYEQNERTKQQNIIFFSSIHIYPIHPTFVMTLSTKTPTSRLFQFYQNTKKKKRTIIYPATTIDCLVGPSNSVF